MATGSGGYDGAPLEGYGPLPPPDAEVDWVQFIVQSFVDGAKTKYLSKSDNLWRGCTVTGTDDDGGVRVALDGGGTSKTVPKEELTTRLQGCQKAEYFSNTTKEWVECVVKLRDPDGSVKVEVKDQERPVKKEELATRLRKKVEVPDPAAGGYPGPQAGQPGGYGKPSAWQPPFDGKPLEKEEELDSKYLCARDLCTKGRRRLSPFCSDECQNQALKERSYYGSNFDGFDRFGGGIGIRLQLDESCKLKVHDTRGIDTGVSRVCLITETTGNLKKWANEDNWSKVTQLDKDALHTRTVKPDQESMLQHIRKHYATSPEKYDSNRIRAGLFRLEDESKFAELLEKTTIKELPMVVYVGKGGQHGSLGSCHVDFANKRLGGGWLCYGFVQEEVMFTKVFDYGALCAKSLLDITVHEPVRDPVHEPVCSRFCMDPHEVWLLRGGRTWAEFPFYKEVPNDWETKLELKFPGEEPEETVVAMDAIKADFHKYSECHLLMMLKKAYTGFVGAKQDGEVGAKQDGEVGAKQVTIATGSWGCGVFYNNENVMFVIQALAANLAGVSLTYRVLGDGLPVQDGFALLEDAFRRRREGSANPATVSEVLDALVKCCADDDFDNFHTKFEKRHGWLPQGRYQKCHF